MVAKMQNPKERIHRAMMTNTSTLVKNVKVKLKRIWHDADGVKTSFLVIHAAHLDDARRFRDPAPKLLSRIRGKKFPPTWGANDENLIMLRFVWIMRKLFYGKDDSKSFQVMHKNLPDSFFSVRTKRSETDSIPKSARTSLRELALDFHRHDDHL